MCDVAQKGEHMELKEIAVQLFEHLCNHDWHGYSQSARWGDGEGTCDVKINGKTYKLQQGDRDCSSAIISAYEAAGISCGGATYTGNMRRCMVGTGNFKWHPMSSGYVAKRGDVYLNEVNHTAMCTSANPDMLGEFSISETGGVTGKTGDQTGQESHIRSYYNYPWDGILECVCKKMDGAVKTSPQRPGKAANNAGLYYRSHVQTYGWLSAVHDGQVSGTTGKGKRLEALKMDTRKLGDAELEATVHIQGIGDKTYKVNKDTHDIVIGTVGKGKRLEAISMRILKGLAGKHIKYRIHVAKLGWSSWVQDGALLGSKGLSNAIQAIQIKIE